VSRRERVEALLGRYVEHHVLHGERLALEELCREERDLLPDLRERVQRYERLERALGALPREAAADDPPLPQFAGFRTIERLGAGGGGEVYKLEDLALGRIVAAKVVRNDSALRAGVDDFLREARSLALFEDPRIVRVHEFRSQADPPVLLMEFVDGFELGRIGRSLEYAQRARVMAEVAEAIHRAHGLGIQHRDLKPANVLLDASLSPKILDFGLSRGEPDLGHGLGTLDYMAPEQLAPGRPIDARTDVYALGVILYELLCGVVPFGGESVEARAAAIRAAAPRLPVEIEPGVPEPLQAIALKAMEREPAERYDSAREMALELRRFLEGKPVLARPTLYDGTLERRLRPHREQIREWLRIRLIHRHEAERLLDAYDRLQVREDDWIVGSRRLSGSQIVLYLGAFLLVCGSLLYFVAYCLEAVAGPWRPALVLGLPFVGLNVAARRLARRDQRAVAVAFYLAAVMLLPLLLLILLQEAGLWGRDAASGLELLAEGFASNRQLQAAALAACAWSCWLAWTTRTVALSACFTALLFALHLVLLGELGLRTWLDERRWDLLALHLVPLLVAVAAAGVMLERRERAWFARPLYLAGVGLFVAILELIALDGRACAYLGLSLAPLQDAEVSDPLLLDTLAAMSFNGLLIYTGGRQLERRGSPLMRPAAWLLLSLSPFAILEPLAWLNGVGEYSRRFDWLYLGLALAIALLSHARQRKSFYYAGLVNVGVALWFLTEHYEWFDRPGWATLLVAVGLAVLVTGFALDARERLRRRG
jgi:serine/threonine protein kinase